MKVNKNISDIMSSQSLFLKDKTTFLKNAFSFYLLSSQGKDICLIFYTLAFVFLFCSVFFHYVTCFSACMLQAEARQWFKAGML